MCPGVEWWVRRARVRVNEGIETLRVSGHTPAVFAVELRHATLKRSWRVRGGFTRVMSALWAVWGREVEVLTVCHPYQDSRTCSAALAARGADPPLHFRTALQRARPGVPDLERFKLS